MISQQILREYLVITTRSMVTNKDIRLEDIVDNIQTFQKMYTLLKQTSEVFEKLLELIQEIPIAGKQIHDANIVATMMTHGVPHLLTHNIDDFKRFSKEIIVLPLESWGNTF